MKPVALMLSAWVLIAGWATASDREYQVVAEKQIGNGVVLRILRSDSIPVAQLHAIPFLRKQTDRVSGFFQLRFDVAVAGQSRAVLIDMLWPAAAPTEGKGSPGSSGFECLALDADDRGIIAVVASLSSVSVLQVDGNAKYVLTGLHGYGADVRQSVDVAPGLVHARLSRSSEGRWIISSSVGAIAYVFEEEANSGAFRRTFVGTGGMEVPR